MSGSEDGEPKEIKVQILTYNGITETFGYVKVDGSFKNNGRIEIKPTISIFGVNMYYPTPDNENRFAFELLFILFLTIDFLLELKQMISATVGSMRKKNKFCCSALLAYWTGDMWNILDSTTIGLLFAQVVQWSYFVTGKNMTVVFFHCAYLCPYLMCTLRPLITDALMHHCTTASCNSLLSSLFFAFYQQSYLNLHRRAVGGCMKACSPTQDIYNFTNPSDKAVTVMPATAVRQCCQKQNCC